MNNTTLQDLTDEELLWLAETWGQTPPKLSESRRKDMIEFGYSTKFSYHLVRLMLECEQILTTGDLVLDRDSEVYKSIRRGDWTLDRLKSWFYNKEQTMETLYANSTLQERPDEDAIKRLLLECLEMHYGSLSAVVTKPSDNGRLLNELKTLVEKYS